MPTKYVVEPGDCIASIAFANGFFPDTIWNHPDNAELKTKRKDPQVLLEGDEVTIPDKQIQQTDGATEQRHRFRLKGVPKVIKIQLIDNSHPVANLGLDIFIDGIHSRATTDGQGWVKHPIPPDAKEAMLRYDNGMEYELDLGHMDPVDEVSGVQKRLWNLGHYTGEIDGLLNDQTVGALKQFQNGHQLTVTGEADDPTKSKLKELTGA
jgi:hypothetical protein